MRKLSFILFLSIIIGLVIQNILWGYIHTVNLVISVIIFILSSYFYIRLKIISKNNQILKREMAILEEEKNKLSQKYRDYDQFFNSFEETALFIYDSVNQKVKFSKGVERLFGFKLAEMNENPEIIKNLLYPDDIKVFAEAEEKLYQGKPVKQEFRYLHPLKGMKWLFLNATSHKNSQGVLERINGKYLDITKQKQLEIELSQMAYFDELTDIPNRKMLDQHIQKALSRSLRQSHPLSFMFIDLDDFKKVNDTLGHDAGDKLLKEVVKRIQQCIREEDLLARFGGDEFIIVFEETEKEEIKRISERIIKNVALPYMIDGNEAKVSLSIGVSSFPEDGMDKETLMKNADKAMYYAKNNGKNNYKMYTHELEELEVDDKGIFKKWMDMFFKSS